MLKTDVIWPEAFRYQSNSDWEPIAFFSEALCNSSSFDLMLGFFSSAAINVLSYGFAAFIYNGGKMRMIINDILSSDDLSAISVAQEPGELPYFDLNDLEQLSIILNKRDKHFFECLAWLIRNNRIDVKITRMVNGAGIAHTKCGIFSDNVNTVSFDGSVNFSLTALIHNKESLSVNCDWNGLADQKRIEDTKNKFESAFYGRDADIEFIDAKKLLDNVQNNIVRKELNELLEDELEIINNTLSSTLPKSIDSILQKTRQKINKAIIEIREEMGFNGDNPRFPYTSGPREYQITAFNNWKNNGQRGFFAMATGTGKTITSLNCLLEIYNRLGYYKALIIVPTISLVDQWAKECQKFRFNNIIKIYSQSPSWKKEVTNLEILESLNNQKKPVNYILICTYASFSKTSINSKLLGLPKNKVLLIADEAHNMGSNQLCTILPRITYGRRIGLSATPYRQYDEKGNRKIGDFFGFKDDEYTFTYSMKEAIEKGVLCRYYYYPHVVNLTDNEFQEYLELSNKIAKYLTYNGSDFKEDPMLTALLIKRKRIVHKAINKVSKFKEIIENYYETKGSLKYSLIYVPEGYTSDFEEYQISEEIEDDSESLRLIDVYTSVVRDVYPTVTVSQFTASTSNRDELLNEFAQGKIDVLTSMKCLDEGVDVPRSELAIFCASTGNPRQFIQRRGRILRTHKDKPYAVIHDLIVAPLVNNGTDAYQVERNLIKSELKRVKDFASLSENPTETLMELTPILNHYNLNLYDEDDQTR